MVNFIISTDTSADLTRSYFEKNKVHYIIMKYILGGKDISELYDSEEEFDKFYELVKSGALPSTSQLNPYELKDYFEDILKKEKDGDIIHLALSSGLSTTYLNAKEAADAVNKDLAAKGEKRRIYAVDSLHATFGMTSQVHKLVEMRDAGLSTNDALEQIKLFQSTQQTWIVVSDLFHLKRGGRISGAKATIGTMLNLRPIIVVNTKGKLAIENKTLGWDKSIKYVLSKMAKLGEKARADFGGSNVYVFRSSKSEHYEKMKKAIKAAYPNINIVEGIIGPVVGTHVGCNCVTVMFSGAPRLEIS